MFRWPIIGVLGSLLLVGCGDSPRVERREMVSPEVAHGMKSPGNQVSPEASPHGVASPHGMTPPALSEAELASEELTLGTIHLTRAKTWVRKPPRSEFVQAEFTLPRAEGDTVDGRLTVTTAGGSAADNIARWRSQFAGKPTKESQEKIEVAGRQVTLVDFSGTYNDQAGPFAPAVERPDYRMLGAIFEVGGKLQFIKCYGPSKTMAARADEFRAFVRSLKVD
jgi:hypothetical protein